jgi:hypothetical protein
MEANMTHMTIPATELQPGDRWVSDSGTVVIDGVLRFAPDPPLWPRGQVRLYGRIVRGVGAGRRTRTWSVQPDQSLDIERAGRTPVAPAPSPRPLVRPDACPLCGPAEKATPPPFRPDEQSSTGFLMVVEPDEEADRE